MLIAPQKQDFKYIFFNYFVNKNMTNRSGDFIIYLAKLNNVIYFF